MVSLAAGFNSEIIHPSRPQPFPSHSTLSFTVMLNSSVPWCQPESTYLWSSASTHRAPHSIRCFHPSTLFGLQILYCEWAGKSTQSRKRNLVWGELWAWFPTLPLTRMLWWRHWMTPKLGAPPTSCRNLYHSVPQNKARYMEPQEECWALVGSTWVHSWLCSSTLPRLYL